MNLKRYRVSSKKSSKILLVMGIFVLILAIFIMYRSYAIYQERQDFDVMKGKVPSLNYDVMVAMKVQENTRDSVFVSEMPEGVNWEVLVTCDHDAIGSWDYDSWSLNVSHITKSKTKCELFFMKPWVKFLSFVSSDYQFDTLHDFLEDTSVISEALNHREAMNYLIQRKDLIEDMKEDEAYISSSIDISSSNTDIRSDLVQTFLDSSVFTNEEKYQYGLPCFVFKDGKSLTSFVYHRTFDYYTGDFSNTISNSIQLSLSSKGNSCTSHGYYTSVPLDLSSYHYSTIRAFINKKDGSATHPDFVTGFGDNFVENRKCYQVDYTVWPSGYLDGWRSTKFSGLEKMYGEIMNWHCIGNVNVGSTEATLYEWYLF